MGENSRHAGTTGARYIRDLALGLSLSVCAFVSKCERGASARFDHALRRSAHRDRFCVLQREPGPLMYALMCEQPPRAALGVRSPASSEPCRGCFHTNSKLHVHASQSTWRRRRTPFPRRRAHRAQDAGARRRRSTARKRCLCTSVSVIPLLTNPYQRSACA